ncbi:ABC transporter ATP-binding protein [Burkholderia pseudomultivorans]|uniref:Maltose/maltodextrin import ATP-binding protein MalK n=1 Tax=Burkholderia pseudomultivorans TaxID=1207504 RepID=A0ABU2E4P5_9BURK|nr:sn-glycerol-3-phosphate ABC transporter ATP-binding protein UgpC [Burkholderia pseudomultivorans]MDR8728114.1 Maltose/maltodextrin import ATP-binding protein MalK [Burkholderia pseudomultivorans]MDR8737138.1 Maltose/maltodextrin import ATP-binding protein MalK [Burkholderia pseudomultivorans]MDR8740307.1 Maltose/maltodextrin import ATP-binding protein MalK [Burkholderia pseudomultivorans]MDR8754609.1 Maltose/maltodextrin import ATP-binding protein MalK [Burkholderia pseudomultivorans]MDR877
MASMSLKHIRKRYDDGAEVIKDVSLDIEDGEFMVFVGPSGCGKSTMLRMLAGLEEITSGDLLIDGRRVNDVPAAKRGLAMVFQNYALYPHMTVYENMAFGLKLAGVDAAETRARVGQAAEALRLSALLDRKPKALSGGQRQRVAIGRAIVRKPGVFLFDEPLSNLDAALRGGMRLELARLHRELGSTMIYVTHDQVEAMTLGNRIAVFNGGRIEQVGAPLSLYEQPANHFVASFLGSPSMNFLPCQAYGSEGAVRLDLPGGSLDAAVSDSRTWPAGPMQLGIRPENIVVGAPGAGLDGRVSHAEHLGDATIVYVELAGHARPLSVRQNRDAYAVAPGQPVGLSFDMRRAHFFDDAGRAL